MSTPQRRRRSAVPALVATAAALFVAAPARGGGYATVGIDMSALSPAAYRRIDGLALEKQLLLRFVQERFAVIAPTDDPTVLLRVTGSVRRITLRATIGPTTTRREVRLQRAPLAELHFELAQKAVELVRASLLQPPPAPPLAPARPEPTPPGPTQAEPAPSTRPAAPVVPAAAPREATVAAATASRASLPPPPPPPATPPEPPRAPAPTLEASSAAAPPWFSVDASISALVRGGGSDPLALLELRIPLRGRWQLVVSNGFVASGGTGLRVVEWTPAAGIELQLPLSSWLELRLGALAGVVLHHFSLDDTAADNPAGNRVDPLLTVPVAVTCWLGRLVGLSLRVAPGVARTERRHSSGDVTLWERGTLRLEAGAALVLRLP